MFIKQYFFLAVHGKNFCKSGIRAARLLWRFLLDTVAVDGLGYCAMHVASILIILGSLAAGFGLPLVNSNDKNSYKHHFYNITESTSFLEIFLFMLQHSISKLQTKLIYPRIFCS